jgi:hypothetical protein
VFDFSGLGMVFQVMAKKSRGANRLFRLCHGWT